jgi:hypothetical protein
MSDISKSLHLVVWDLVGGNNKLNLKCTCCSAKVQLETSECVHLIAKKNGGATTTTNLRIVCKKCKIAIGDDDLLNYKPVAVALPSVTVPDFLSQRRGENTKFEDGTSAAMSHNKLAFLGIIKLDWDTSKTHDAKELAADYKKLGDILHKYKICHRDDVGPKKPEATVKQPDVAATKPQEQKPSSAAAEPLCVATTASGQPCTKKAKNGIYCGVHDKNK